MSALLELVIDSEEITELVLPDFADNEETLFEVAGTIAAINNLTATATVTHPEI
jgi:hypothetical protein